jgi:hypothetical protein
MTTGRNHGGQVSRSGALFAVLAIGLFGITLPAQGQVAWDGPLMVGPGSPAGWGLYLTDPSPGRGIGVMTTWRRSVAPGTGYRVGLAEGREDKLAVYGGIDVSDYLLRESDDFPMDMLWVTGGGVGVGDNILLTFPIGVSVGRDFQADDVWFNPYFTPRVVLDAWFGDDRPDRNLRLGFVADLGVDISFDPGWAVRFAGTLGQRDAVAIGISFRAF